MPPPQALLALHGLWCLVFLPLVVGAIRFCPARRLRLGVRLATWFVVIGLTALIGVQTITWLPAVRSEDRRYLPQRIVYVIATSPELPLVPSLLACAACWIAGSRRVSPAEPSAAQLTNFVPHGCKEPSASPTNKES